jgi:choice-of-anchor A domain-containing protein
MGGSNVFHMSAGTYIGSAELVVDSGPIIINVMGAGLAAGAYAVDFSGNSLTNLTFNPLNFQILYAGTNPIRLTGGSATAATVYAPNADVTLTGGGDFFGSIIGRSVNVNGGSQIHYDRNLANTAFNIGNYMLSGFTWNKF